MRELTAAPLDGSLFCPALLYRTAGTGGPSAPAELSPPALPPLARRPHLEGIDDAVQEFDDEERRHLALDNGHEEDLVAVDAEQVVVGRGDHRRHVLRLRGPLLRLEEVVADGAADDALPVLLEEDVPRGVDEEQAVDHGCGGRSSRRGRRAAAPGAQPPPAPPARPPLGSANAPPQAPPPGAPIGHARNAPKLLGAGFGSERADWAIRSQQHPIGCGGARRRSASVVSARCPGARPEGAGAADAASQSAPRGPASARAGRWGAAARPAPPRRGLARALRAAASATRCGGAGGLTAVPASRVL